MSWRCQNDDLEYVCYVDVRKNDGRETRKNERPRPREPARHPAKSMDEMIKKGMKGGKDKNLEFTKNGLQTALQEFRAGGDLSVDFLLCFTKAIKALDSLLRASIRASSSSHSRMWWLDCDEESHRELDPRELTLE